MVYLMTTGTGVFLINIMPNTAMVYTELTQKIHFITRKDIELGKN